MDEKATAFCWLALGFVGLIAGGMQRRGKDYFPANRLLGLCIGAPGVYWLFWYARFDGDVGRLRAWSGPAHAALWLYGAQLLLALWALLLVFRVVTGRAGSSADLSGHLGPPTAEMVEEALVIIGRGDHHEIMTEVQRKWLDEDRNLRLAARKAATRALARQRRKRHWWWGR